MKIIKNQTIYQCSYCGRRLLTKTGCKLHETQYCQHAESPNQKRLIALRTTCGHSEYSTVYRYMGDGTRQEPDYDVCLNCGERF